LFITIIIIMHLDTRRVSKHSYRTPEMIINLY